ncbi:MAG TPA: GDSL-type esterase/lipase family protein [Kiritimatiellia bacterium]|nr:GDSL-type esterase/lipase family protein [Kiritimatiellia bacterium]
MQMPAHTLSSRPWPSIFPRWLFPFVASIALLIAAGCESDKKSLGSGHDFGDNDENLVLAMGDSITKGGFSGGTSWPTRFAARTGKSTINDGIAGATSGVGASRIQDLLARRKPGFVIIFYGANDAIRSVNVERTAANIDAMIGAALDNGSIPVVATVLPMAEARSVFNGNVEAINLRIREIAKARRVKLVDLNRAVGDTPEEFYTDGLHLNNRGEDLVALEFADLF